MIVMLVVVDIIRTASEKSLASKSASYEKTLACLVPSEIPMPTLPLLALKLVVSVSFVQYKIRAFGGKPTFIVLVQLAVVHLIQAPLAVETVPRVIFGKVQNMKSTTNKILCKFDLQGTVSCWLLCKSLDIINWFAIIDVYLGLPTFPFARKGKYQR